MSLSSLFGGGDSGSRSAGIESGGFIEAGDIRAQGFEEGGALRATGFNEARIRQNDAKRKRILELQSGFIGSSQTLQPGISRGARAAGIIEDAATVGGFDRRLGQIFASDTGSRLIEERGRAVQGQLSAGGLSRSGRALTEAARVPTEVGLGIEQRLFGRTAGLEASGRQQALALSGFRERMAQGISGVRRDAADRVGGTLIGAFDARAGGVEGAAEARAGGIEGAAEARAQGVTFDAQADAQGGSNFLDTALSVAGFFF